MGRGGNLEAPPDRRSAEGKTLTGAEGYEHFAEAGLGEAFLDAGATLTLAAGAMVVRWVSDWMEEGGLGDGVSLMICVSVLTGYGGSLLRCAVAP
jgi:preprotein translocase subunit SecY